MFKTLNPCLAACSAAVLLLGLLSEVVEAQERSPGFRKLAPGVITRISPHIQEEETFSGPREMVELTVGAPQLDWEPNLSAKSKTLLADVKATIFRRSVWGLEFGFKPLSMMDIDIPQPDGSVKTEKVLYLVYFVRNNGNHLNPEAANDGGQGTFEVNPTNHSVRFFPNFFLQCHDVDRVYLDKVIPAAVNEIRLREDPNRKFYNSVTISDVNIPVSTELEDNSVWGVATWVGVDPRSDFFSIYVRGLTNAYRWQDPPNGFKAGDPPGTGRRFLYKTLQLNFWRPGDSLDHNEDEIRFGVPNQNQLPSGISEDQVLKAYGLKERVDYQWVYR